MIPKSDIEHKASEIMEYSDESFAIAKEAVDLRPDIPEKSSFRLEDSVDKTAAQVSTRAERSKQLVEDKLLSIKP